MTEQASQAPIEVRLGWIDDKNDFMRLLDLALPMEGNQRWRKESMGGRSVTVIQLNPLYIDKANIIFKKNHLPQVDATRTVTLAAEAETARRPETAVEVYIEAEIKLLLVFVDGIRHEVEYTAMDVLWGILKEFHDLKSRQLWYHLIQRHGLYPELKEIDRVLVGAVASGQLTQERSFELRRWLDDKATDIFEGTRRRRSDDTKTYYCLHPKQEVVCNPAPKPISELAVGDSILGGDGRFHPVAGVSSRPFKGNLLEIKTYLTTEPMRVTPEHQFLVVDSKSRWRSGLGRKRSIRGVHPRFDAASNLRRGQFLVFPKMREEPPHGLHYLDMLAFDRWKRYKSDGKGYLVSGFGPKVKLKRMVWVNKYLARLIGYYLSEGSIVGAGNMTAFTFNSKETSLHAEVRESTERAFHLKTRERTIGNAHYIYINSRLVADFFSEFGRGARNKRIPRWVYGLNPYVSRELVRAYFEGDGTEKEPIHFTAFTMSKALAMGIRLLLTRLDIYPAIFTQKVKQFSGSALRKKPSSEFAEGYQISVGERFLQKMSEIMNYHHPWLDKRSRVYAFAMPHKDIFLVRLDSVKSVPYEGQVYNLEVDSEDHTYALPSAVTHNSIAYHPILVLEKLGLVEFLRPNRGLKLTEKGEELDGWLPVAVTELSPMERW